MKSRLRYTPAQIEHFLTEMAQGKTIKEVADEAGVHMRTVATWKRRFGQPEQDTALSSRGTLALVAEIRRLTQIIGNLIADRERLRERLAKYERDLY